MNDWLTEHPEVRSITVAVADLNGQARGKRMPAAFAAKALKGGTRMPLSGLNVDIRGDDIEDSPLVFETGDRDGIRTCRGAGERVGLVPPVFAGSSRARSRHRSTRIRARRAR